MNPTPAEIENGSPRAASAKMPAGRGRRHREVDQSRQAERAEGAVQEQEDQRQCHGHDDHRAGSELSAGARTGLPSGSSSRAEGRPWRRSRPGPRRRTRRCRDRERSRRPPPCAGRFRARPRWGLPRTSRRRDPARRSARPFGSTTRIALIRVRVVPPGQREADLDREPRVLLEIGPAGRSPITVPTVVPPSAAMASSTSDALIP